MLSVENTNVESKCNILRKEIVWDQPQASVNIERKCCIVTLLKNLLP